MIFSEIHGWASYQKSTKHEATHNLLDLKYHFQPEAPVCKPQECAAHGRHSNIFGSLLEFCIQARISQCHLVLACLEISVLLVTLDKLVRLRERIRSLTSVAYCSCMCVRAYFLACLCLSVFEHGMGELCTLFSLWVLFAEWCGDLSPYPTSTGPFSSGLCPESPKHAFDFIEHEGPLPLRAFSVTLRASFRLLRPKYF